MIQTDIHYEVTDTYGGEANTYWGEANYSWVKRGKIENALGEDFSDLAVVRRVKKSIGWNDIHCNVTNYGDDIEIRPVGINQVCFISFHSHGSAS